MSFGRSNEGQEKGFPKLLTDAANDLNRWWMESGVLDDGAVSHAIQTLDTAAELLERATATTTECHGPCLGPEECDCWAAWSAMGEVAEPPTAWLRLRDAAATVLERGRLYEAFQIEEELTALETALREIWPVSKPPGSLD